MKKVVIGILLFSVLALAIYLFKNRTEHYKIVYRSYLTSGDLNPLPEEQRIYYSTEEVRKHLSSAALEKSGLIKFDLNNHDLIACVITNYTVNQVVGREGIGFIMLNRSEKEGVSFTVFQGTKRFFQFAHAPKED